jgi:hypothetical protein
MFMGPALVVVVRIASGLMIRMVEVLLYVVVPVIFKLVMDSLYSSKPTDGPLRKR